MHAAVLKLLRYSDIVASSTYRFQATVGNPSRSPVMQRLATVAGLSFCDDWTAVWTSIATGLSTRTALATWMGNLLGLG